MSVQQAEHLLLYYFGIVKTVKDDLEVVQRAARLLHQILWFTIETSNTSGKLEFLYLPFNLKKQER